MSTPTTDQLRNAIDSGATGEKVSMPDPAAAPFGTDAEAAGASPTQQERAMEAAAVSTNAISPAPARSGRALYVAAILAIAVLLLAILVLARS